MFRITLNQNRIGDGFSKFKMAYPIWRMGYWKLYLSRMKKILLYST